MSAIQRITVTRKGKELQEQLREQAKKEPIKEVVKSLKGTLHDLQLQKGPNANDQLTNYAELVDTRLNSPEQINTYLSTKFSSKGFVARELTKISNRVVKLGPRSSSELIVLPSLDFRQQQIINTKYNGSFDAMSKTGSTCKNNLIKKVHKIGSDELKNKKVSYMLFQESKLERMIKKFEKFNDKTKDIPMYSKGEIRTGTVQRLLKSMENDQETRVETIQEVNERLHGMLGLMSYTSQLKDRQRQAMMELHDKKYKKIWQKVHFPN